MADAKLSSFAAATVLNATDLVPILQSGTNRIATLGQVKSFTQTPSSTTVTAGSIPLSLPFVYVTGTCTLPGGSIDGTRLVIYGMGPGSISSVGLLPSDGYRFDLGAYVELFWANSKWNPLVSSGMILGLV